MERLPFSLCQISFLLFIVIMAFICSCCFCLCFLLSPFTIVFILFFCLLAHAVASILDSSSLPSCLLINIAGFSLFNLAHRLPLLVSDHSCQRHWFLFAEASYPGSSSCFVFRFTHFIHSSALFVFIFHLILYVLLCFLIHFAPRILFAAFLSLMFLSHFHMEHFFLDFAWFSCSAYTYTAKLTWDISSYCRS